MKRLISHIFYIVVAAVFTACGFFDGSGEDKVVARVGDHYLTEKQLYESVNTQATEDSATLIDNYIDNWVKEQLLIQKAIQNLSEEEANFKKQLESYRNSLVIYTYENKLVEQKLDTAVSQKEVEAYFEANKSNFDLNETIYQARYIKFINSAPRQDSLKHWLFSEVADFNLKLADYCTQFASNCQLDTTLWTPISTFSAIFPTKSTTELVEDLSLGANIISDSSTSLMVDVKTIIKSGETAPIEYVEDQIKGIIRNRRRLKLIANAKQEIYEEATLKKKYDVYR
ncbi:MAG: hypothetical protein WD530_00725 [Vicingaceae bacterium]